MKNLKHIWSYLGLITLLPFSIFWGCSKDNPEIEIPDFSHIRPQPTAKGTAGGSPMTKVIGSAGGEIVSADGKLKVSIPAGALSSNTTIGIQPITNTAPLGLGQNYRLTPEGVDFTQPVKLTFSYDEGVLGNVVPEFLWVVTQNADGTWAGGRKSVVNKSNKTVSVSTTHFSDWGIGRFMDIALKPAATSVKKGERVELSITGFKYDPDSDDYPPLGLIDDGLVGLNDAQQLLLSTEQFATFRVKDWALNGTKSPVNSNKGKLEVAGKKATYTAPGETPNPATVTVAVNLEAKDNIGQLHGYSLLSDITVVGDFYLKLTVNGTDYLYNPENHTTPGAQAAHYASFDGLGFFGITGFTVNRDGPSIAIKAKANGTGAFKLDVAKGESALFFPDNFSAQNTFHYTIEDVDYVKNLNGLCYLSSKKTSPFSINITRFDPPGSNPLGRVVEGTFSGDLGEMTADWKEKECRANSKKVQASGEFRLILLSSG